MNVTFNRYNVRSGDLKAKVFYSLDNRTDKRKCVTLYADDYTGTLGKIFSGQYENDTDLMTDYFDKGKAVLFEDHPLYAAARARAEMSYPARKKGGAK